MLPIEFSPARDSLINALEALPVYELTLIMHEVDKRFDEHYAKKVAERAQKYRERIAAAHARINHIARYPDDAVSAGMIAAVRRLTRLDKMERFVADNDRYAGIPLRLLDTILHPRIIEFGTALQQVMETHAKDIATLRATYEDTLRTVRDELDRQNPLLAAFYVYPQVRPVHDERCRTIAMERVARNRKALRYIRIAHILMRNARWQLYGLKP